MNKNIILAGVGGQGLVLTTKIVCHAAHNDGYDVKSNDVVGLSQRGGKVWGNVRIGEKVYSPNILPGSADFLLAFEPLEGYRFSRKLRDSGIIIMNTAIIPPVPVIAEKEEYPENIEKLLSESYKVIAIDGVSEGIKLGSSKVANTFLLGILASNIAISKESWHKALRENVPEKFIDMNLNAFEIGFEFK